MRIAALVAGLSLVLPAAALAQDRDRPRSRHEEPRRYEDGPRFRFRYAPEERSAEIEAYRRWSPSLDCGRCPGGRCSDREWRAIERCERKALEIERREREWRREARAREARFERDMARREQEFRRKELERLREHQRDMARRWRELERYR